MTTQKSLHSLLLTSQTMGLNSPIINLHYDINLKFEIPDDIKTKYEAALEKWTHLVRYNSVRAKPYSFNMKDDTIDIVAGPLSYVETRALQDCMPSASLQHSISSLSITVALLSHEGQLLICKRSHQVSRYPDIWSIGFSEGLEDQDFKQEDIRLSAMRALIEELAFEDIADKSFFHTLGLSVSPDTQSINLLILADLRGYGISYSSQHILHQAPLAHDAWEHSALEFISPTQENFYDIVKKDYISGNEQYLILIENYLAKK